LNQIRTTATRAASPPNAAEQTKLVDSCEAKRRINMRPQRSLVVLAHRCRVVGICSANMNPVVEVISQPLSVLSTLVESLCTGCSTDLPSDETWTSGAPARTSLIRARVLSGNGRSSHHAECSPSQLYEHAVDLLSPLTNNLASLYNRIRPTRCFVNNSPCLPLRRAVASFQATPTG